MRRSLPFHYAWIIVATGAVILFACLGLARYAYTMLLPGMSAGLCLSYDRMGFISTGNFVGYFFSVLLAPRLLRHFSPRQIIVAGLLLISSCRGRAGAEQGQRVRLPSFQVEKNRGIAQFEIIGSQPCRCKELCRFLH